MEKSFLNFKAAHPDWTPNDPSGSLYLSRMADLSAAHPNAITRRRLLPFPQVAPFAESPQRTWLVFPSGILSYGCKPCFIPNSPGHASASHYTHRGRI